MFTSENEKNLFFKSLFPNNLLKKGGKSFNKYHPEKDFSEDNVKDFEITTKKNIRLLQHIIGITQDEDILQRCLLWLIYGLHTQTVTFQHLGRFKECLDNIGIIEFYVNKYKDKIIYANGVTIRTKSGLSYDANIDLLKALLNLSVKNFKDGFNGLDARFLNKDWYLMAPSEKYVKKIQICKSRDDLEELQEGEKVLIVYEQGIGDTFQFMRFAIDLCKGLPHIKFTILIWDKIIHLFNIKEKNIRLRGHLPSEEHILEDEYKYKIFITSCPKMLNLENMAPYKGKCYIKNDRTMVKKWKEKLTNLPGIKIGLFHSGYFGTTNEKKIDLSCFKEISDLDISLISLHKEEIEGTIENYHKYDIDKSGAFLDTIGILKNIDLLITVDSSIAHLGGCLNIPTWLLLGRVADWRWGSDIGHESDWYKNLNILRNNKYQDWTYLMKLLRSSLIKEYNLTDNRSLNEISHNDPPPNVPVSIGELYDKYSILNIKKSKIKDKEKINHVVNEINYLSPFIEKYNVPLDKYKELEDINLNLWEIEDKIRDKESKQEFDDEFIQLARDVYKTNDKRGDIKLQINKLMKSAIYEVKDYKLY